MEINRLIDHTLLKPEATEEQILKIIAEAIEYKFYSVCINPTWVPLAAEKLKGAPVAVCTVIGFPLGANTTETKVFEANNAIENGADEIDMVINIGAMKAANYELVLKDIEAVVKTAKDRALVKVIIETALLTREEIIKASEIVKASGADFVKTSTGFSTHGALVEDVKLMRETVGPTLGVKAAGGVHNLEEALAMVEAGATRIGASSGVAIMNGLSGNAY
jgi:deoxyribose-phosphate aldolase